MTCILCEQTNLAEFHTSKEGLRYIHCPACDLRFLHPEDRLSYEDERLRYTKHNNDVNDDGYREFVRPLMEEILQRQDSQDWGLDYGAGTGPVLTTLLREQDFQIELYDPFFWPETSVLERTYDYIFACEVIEHFRNPRKEFLHFRELLKPSGHLYVMTLSYEPGMDFENWHYRRDPTHISFYSQKTFDYLAEAFEFQCLVSSHERVTVFQRKDA